MPILFSVAQVGFALYMFLVGLEFDLALIRARATGTSTGRSVMKRGHGSSPRAGAGSGPTRAPASRAATSASSVCSKRS